MKKLDVLLWDAACSLCCSWCSSCGCCSWCSSCGSDWCRNWITQSHSCGQTEAEHLAPAEFSMVSHSPAHCQLQMPVKDWGRAIWSPTRPPRRFGFWCEFWWGIILFASLHSCVLCCCKWNKQWRLRVDIEPHADCCDASYWWVSLLECQHSIFALQYAEILTCVIESLMKTSFVWIMLGNNQAEILPAKSLNLLFALRFIFCQRWFEQSSDLIVCCVFVTFSIWSILFGDTHHGCNG